MAFQTRNLNVIAYANSEPVKDDIIYKGENNDDR